MSKKVAATFFPAGLPTLIGSLPLSDHNIALDLIFSHTPAIPLWPQLPSNPQEGMLNQFVEGFPGVVENSEKTYVSTAVPGFEEALLAFFEDYLTVSDSPAQLQNSRFAISPQRAAGLYLLRDKARNSAIKALKGQITGPFTLLTGLADQDHKLAFYDPTLHEMLVKGLAMKAAWQVGLLKDLHLPVLLFIDEPALAGLGSSSFISISKEEIGNDISEVVQAVHQAGGMAGVHVCANTDWSFLLALDLDVISFDAYGFFDRFITCKEEVHAYLDNGGIIAWGIVPTSNKEHIQRESAASLVKRWEDQASQLAGGKWDIKALLDRTLITPSCGTGSLPLELASKVLELTRDVSQTLRSRYLTTS